MPHSLYRTEGLILGSKNLGEANRLIYLLTPGLGLVTAVAQGVRNLSSKLRYHLQDFSWGEFILVRGRDYWRLTGTESNNLSVNLLEDPSRRGVFLRICRLLYRLIRGEGNQRNLFFDLKTSFHFLSQQTFDRETLFQYELLLALRLLHHLGYVEELKLLKFLGPNLVWGERILNYSRTERVIMLQAVNQALHHSQL